MITNAYLSALAVYQGILATRADVTTYSGYVRSVNSSLCPSPILKTVTKTVKFTSDINSGNANSASAVTGVIFGNGNAPATPNDYKMAGDLMSNGSVSVAQSENRADDGSYVELVNIYTVTNAMNEDFTIAEVGVVGGFGNNSQNYFTCLLDRTVLETPITIPAGGVGVVTYTIRMNYPTE